MATPSSFDLQLECLLKMNEIVFKFALFIPWSKMLIFTSNFVLKFCMYFGCHEFNTVLDICMKFHLVFLFDTSQLLALKEKSKDDLCMLLQRKKDYNKKCHNIA